MKKLLVLGAGLLQVPIIRKAKEMGVYVIAADDDAEALGTEVAMNVMGHINNEFVYALINY